jgi:uncharacterized phage-associated protein
MADWSPAIANEFIRRARSDKKMFTQMQLQKLVYIAHGWNLAINGQPLTWDSPEAWEYGPVYKELRKALRNYGREGVTRQIRNDEYTAGQFDDEADANAVAAIGPSETAVIDRVYRDYGKFHAFQLSALTHREGTPWTTVYDGGRGKFEEIPSEMIRNHFVELATKTAA